MSSHGNARRRELYAERIAAGLCGHCGQPREDLKFNRCMACRNINRDYQARAYKRQIFVTLAPDQLQFVKSEATRTGKPKAHIIVEALNFYITSQLQNPTK